MSALKDLEMRLAGLKNEHDQVRAKKISGSNPVIVGTQRRKQLAQLNDIMSRIQDTERQIGVAKLSQPPEQFKEYFDERVGLKKKRGRKPKAAKAPEQPKKREFPESLIGKLSIVVFDFLSSEGYEMERVSVSKASDKDGNVVEVIAKATLK